MRVYDPGKTEVDRLFAGMTPMLTIQPEDIDTLERLRAFVNLMLGYNEDVYAVHDGDLFEDVQLLDRLIMAARAQLTEGS
jgi:hypothetical protein